MPNDASPDWERVLSSASRLQRILPDAVLVGGTASAVGCGQKESVGEREEGRSGGQRR